MRVKHQRRPGRVAFTIVELLVVLLIILLLVSLTASAIMRFSTTGKGLATQTHLDKIRSTIEAQVKAASTQAQSESMTAGTANQGQAKNSDFLAQAQTNLGISSLVDPRLRSEFVRLKVIQAVPTTFDEALYLDARRRPQGNPQYKNLSWAAYQKFLATLNVLPTNRPTWRTTPAEVQQGVCLLMVLKYGPRTGGLTEDDVGTSAVGKVTIVNGQQAPGNQAPAIVDAWGRPVMVVRRYGETPPAAPGARPAMALWKDLTIALLSAGRGPDRATDVYGVDRTTMNITDTFGASDNVLSTANQQPNFGAPIP
jgi:type II secretory pathway pseudopilin PulG